MKKFKRPFMGCAACAAGVFTAFTVWQNIRVKTTFYDLHAENLPSAFDGFRIALLADIHSRRFGEKQEQLLSRVRAAKPDLILVAGDWLDARRGNMEDCIAQAKGLRAIAPVCGVYGNHEQRRIRKTGQDCFGPALSKAGVQMLHTSGTRIERGGMYLNLIGVEDPAELPEHPRKKEMTKSMDEMLGRVMNGVLPDEFTILIAHRPEFLSIYARYPIDLVCAGHAHGGQVRLPGVGGLFAPGQGLFPKYTGGKYAEHQTTMVVSRGLGGREAPIRILNMPELVVLTLKAGA
ncbi:MAG: metallophosphoesterase [Butyricicoccus sp.]